MSAAALEIVNPVATPRSHAEDGERYDPAKRLDTLDGKTVVLY